MAPSTKLFSFHSYRMAIGLLLMYAFYTSISMRSNLGMAMVCMVNSTAHLNPIPVKPTNMTKMMLLPCDSRNQPETHISHGYRGKILWSSRMQSLLFSANFFGGMLIVVPAGLLADHFDPKLIMLIAIGNMSFFSLLTPVLSNFNFWAVFVARVLMGFGEGVIMPTMASMSARWFPPTERSTAAAIYTSGNQLASSTISFISVILCSVNFLDGWPLIFYLTGANAVVWIILWSIFASNSPDKNKFISADEKAYLNETLSNPQRKLTNQPTPWRSIIRSLPVLANLLATLVFTFTQIMMQSFLPTYFKEILLIDLKSNGLYTTLPFATQLVFKYVFAIISDKLKMYGLISATNVCKLLQTLGHLLQAFSLVVIGFYVSCATPLLAAFMLVLQGIGLSTSVPGTVTSCLSLAPNHSGTITSLAMLSAQFGGLLAPSLIAALKSENSKQEWTQIFVISAILNIVSAVFFAIWASADLQPWAIEKQQTNELADCSSTTVVNTSKMRTKN